MPSVPNFQDLARQQRSIINSRLSYKNVVNSGNPTAQSVHPGETFTYAICLKSHGYIIDMNLSNITLVIVDTRDPENACKALDICCTRIRFGATKLITSAAPDVKTLKHQLHIIPNLDWHAYSQFMVKELCNYVDTDFCLVCQTDGFIINPHLWNDDFYNYDYIGAKWDTNR
ncbi:MAG: hypothetical protein EBU90_24925, partial [Proteobacteria bacterium]|nr:hypothetical protein [Pseudomonadota bacterium]